MANSAHTTVDPAEIERFSRIAGEWWDPAGKFAPLHRLNPLRIGYIRDRAAAHWKRDPLAGAPLQGLSLLDIGCGGGLLSEPMARLGAHVTGVDAAARNIRVAALHAGKQGLDIDYRQGAAEALAEAGSQFDIVLALEIVEHVADVPLFLKSCGRMVKPGGLLFLSTLNRTAKAWALAIAGGGIHPALAAARHARLEKVPETFGSRERPRRRGHRRPGDRGRGLQPAQPRLVAQQERPRRELHAVWHAALDRPSLPPLVLRGEVPA